MALQIGITGQNSRDPKYSPQRYLKEERAQELVVELCKHPVPVAAVERPLLENLLLVQAVRVQDGQCYLNFTCFLRADIGILNDRGAAFGSSLADAVHRGLSHNDFPSLRFMDRGQQLPGYLFFLVGCVVLDWHALDLLSRKGYTLSPSETVHPAGGNFTIFGNEIFERSLRELYWGSHNETWGDYTFTSFGDHNSVRQCLPDLVWRIRSYATPDSEMAFLRQARDQAIRCYVLDVARHLTAEHYGDEELQAHLEALRYMSDRRPAIPVLVAEDHDVTRAFLREMDLVVSSWIGQHNDEMRRAFGSLAPLRQGVPWREVLIQVWHYIFAHANRRLCTIGVFLNPYSSASSFPGYLPALFHRDCDLWALLAA